MVLSQLRLLLLGKASYFNSRMQNYGSQSSCSKNRKTLENNISTNEDDTTENKRSQYWNTRNNSANVSAVLNSELYTTHAKPLIVSNPYYINNDEEEKTETYACEDCYCQKSPVSPKLKLHPPADIHDKTIMRRRTTPNDALRRSNQFYKWKHPKNDCYIPCFEYTSPRRRYERITQNLSKPNELPRFETVERSKSSYPGDDWNLENNIDNLFLSSEVASKDLQQLNTFRKGNYFDCHDTSIYKSNNNENHKCVHKFALNNRLIPQAINADAFGLSRCMTCNKPMKIGGSQFCQGFTGNPVTIGNDKKIEVKVTSNDKYNQLMQDHFKIKKPTPSNSLALRHQKGVV